MTITFNEMKCGKSKHHKLQYNRNNIRILIRNIIARQKTSEKRILKSKKYKIKKNKQKYEIKLNV